MSDSFWTLFKKIRYVPLKRGRVRVVALTDFEKYRVILPWKTALEIGNKLREISLESAALEAIEKFQKEEGL